MECPNLSCGSYDAICRPVIVAPCTSDIHVIDGFSADRRGHIIGHEAIGEVVEVGNKVRYFKPGDLAVVASVTPDWNEPRIQGKHNAHDDSLFGSFKFSVAKPGVMAEFFNVNFADANMIHLPDNVSAESALMAVDCMNTGFAAVESANISFGDKVVVIGAGPIGLMSIAASLLRGAGQLIAVASRDKSIELAFEYGANDVVSYKDDYVEYILGKMGEAPDSVIITGGNESTFENAVRLASVTGTVSNVNFFNKKSYLGFPAPYWNLGMANKSIRGAYSVGGALRLQKMLELIKYKRVDPSKLITHRYYGFDRIADAYKIMREKPPSLIKPIVLIDW